MGYVQIPSTLGNLQFSGSVYCYLNTALGNTISFIIWVLAARFSVTWYHSNGKQNLNKHFIIII
jgi:hypothetical protein